MTRCHATVNPHGGTESATDKQCPYPSTADAELCFYHQKVALDLLESPLRGKYDRWKEGRSKVFDRMDAA